MAKLNPDKTNFNPNLKEMSFAKFKKAFDAAFTGDAKKFHDAIKDGKHLFKDRK